MSENTYPNTGTNTRLARLEAQESIYLDWVNNFLTMGVFADYYGVEVEEARAMVATGKAANLELCKEPKEEKISFSDFMKARQS